MASKDYHRKYNRERYHRIRAEVVDKLGGVCAKCGSAEDLQVDHTNPSEKAFDSKKWLNVSSDVLWKEIEKCQLLCSKCHTEKTISDRGQSPAKNSHGTLSSYRYCGPPKCEACKKAKRDYTREYFRKNPRDRKPA